RTAKLLCGKYRDLGFEKTPDEIEQVLQDAWAQFAETREKEAAELAARAASTDEQDPDTREQKRLAGTPADIRAEAEALLRDKDLIKRILEAVEVQGVAGEPKLALDLFLTATSRKLRRPVASRLKGPSSSGKSHLVERVTVLMPPESVIIATAMT